MTQVNDKNSDMENESQETTQRRQHIIRLQSKTFEWFFRSYSELLSKFDETSFQEYVSEGIPDPTLTVI